MATRYDLEEAAQERYNKATAEAYDRYQRKVSIAWKEYEIESRPARLQFEKDTADAQRVE
jgi:hypothetical protein